MPSPIVSATLQAAALSASSNLFAQTLSLYTSSPPSPFSFQTLLHFTLFAILSTPPNFLWQEYLESRFPSNKAASTVTPVSSSDEKGKPISPPTRLSKTNTAMKFLLDQLFAGPVNTLLFLYAMGYMQGLRGELLGEHVRSQFWGLTKAGLKVWPAVSLGCFLAVPVERRVLVGGVVGFAWNVYLGLLAAAGAGK